MTRRVHWSTAPAPAKGECYTIEAASWYTVFWRGSLTMGGLKRRVPFLTHNRFGEKINRFDPPDEKFHTWPRYTTRKSLQIINKWGVFSDDFGLRSPVIQKPFSPKKGIP